MVQFAYRIIMVKHYQIGFTIKNNTLIDQFICKDSALSFYIALWERGASTSQF